MVVGRVAALFARTGLPRACHVLIEAVYVREQLYLNGRILRIEEQDAQSAHARSARRSVRELTVARPDQDQSLPHIGLVGDTYTILVTGADTAGKYTLIHMHVPPGGGPPPTGTTSRRCSPFSTAKSR